MALPIAARHGVADLVTIEPTIPYRDAIARQEAAAMPEVETIFDDVYEAPTPGLVEQRSELMGFARVKSPHAH